MMCAWQQLLNILPGWLAGEVDMHEKKELQEIRLRLGALPELKTATGSFWLNRGVSSEDRVLLSMQLPGILPGPLQPLPRGF